MDPAQQSQTPPPAGPRRTARQAILAAARRLAAPFILETTWLALTRPSVAVADLPPAWDGATVALLADLHAGSRLGWDYLRRVGGVVNDARPDVVALVGDFVNWYGHATPELAEVLGELRAREGRFAVLGNHDHRADAAGVTAALAAAGIEVLSNAHRLLSRRGQQLCLAGVDDYRHGRPDARAALTGVPEATPRVLLCHNPDYAEDLPPALRVDLMLCGHTHGGQIRSPAGSAPFLSVRYRKYGHGLVRGPRCRVYTTRGIGAAHLPLRLNCRPELPILTLRRAVRRPS
jgi:predicted MPP superfamily phosphohydrolase